MTFFKKTKLFIVAVSLLLGFTNNVFGADVLITHNPNTNLYDSDAGNHLGQSFEATKTGIISKIKVAAVTAYSGTLKIYNGAGDGGTLLHTQSISLTNTNPGKTDYVLEEIVISDSISITNGSMYTFIFENNSEDFIYTDNTYADGQLFVGSASVWQAGYDMVFEVVQGDTPSANATPTFDAGATNTLTVAEDASATDIKAKLLVTDSDGGDTLTWTQSSAPSHGTLNISSATASGGSNISSGGTITYTPTASYNGADSFDIQVSDGTATDTITINVTVVGDTTNPTISTLSPTHNSTTASVDGNLILTFDEPVVAGEGSIIIRHANDDSIAEVISATSASVTINNNVVTINPINTFDFATQYYVMIQTTAFEDSSGNGFAGILNDSTWGFTTASNSIVTIGGTTGSLTVNDNDATLTPFSNITFADTDSDSIQVRIATVYNGSEVSSRGYANDGLINWGSVASVQAQVRALTFTPVEHYDSVGTVSNLILRVKVYENGNDTIGDYTVANNDTTIALTSVNDTPTDMSLSSSTVSQSGGTNATVGNISTVDLDNSVDNTHDSFTYTLVAGSGDTNNALFNFNSNILRANDASALDPSTTYSIRVQTDDGHSATYSEAFSITVTDDTNPTMSSLSPADDSTEKSTATNLILTLNEDASIGTGNILIKKTSDDSTVETIDVTSDLVTIVDGVITINPSTTLDFSTQYYVLVPATAFDDSSGNSYAGLTATTDWSFTTIVNNAPVMQDSTFASHDTDGTLEFTQNFTGNTVESGEMIFKEDAVMGGTYAFSLTSTGIAKSSVASDGTLTFVDETTLANANFISSNSNSSYIYVGASDKIYLYSMSSFGALTLANQLDIIAQSDLEISSNGNFLYTLVSSELTAYSIESDGTLTFVNSSLGDDFDDFVDISIDPNGKYIYTTSDDEVGTASYSIDQITGAITLIGINDDEDSDYDKLIVSPNGKFLYVTNGSYLLLYSINQDTGVLTFIEKIQHPDIDNMNNPIVSANSKFIYTTEPDHDTVALFSINQTDGTLTFVKDYTNLSDGITGLEYPRTMRQSIDGTKLYVSSRDSNSISVFDIDQDIVGSNIEVAENTTTVMELNATDSDGDTLSYSIIGGTDASVFSIDSSSGAIVFNTAKDYETPSSANSTNIYELIVKVVDIYDVNDTTTMYVEITDTYEPPVQILETLEISQGTTSNSTKVVFSSKGGRTLKYMYSNSSIDTPAYGANAPLEALAYTSGDDIPTAEVGKYLIIYGVNPDGTIYGFKQHLLVSDDINIDTGTTPTPTNVTVESIPDFLVDINTSKFVESNGTKVNNYDLSQYFTNATSHNYILKDTNNTVDWLGLNSTTADMNLTTNIVENNTTLLDTKHFIKITGLNSDSNTSTYFTIRFKDLNASLAQYMEGNVTLDGVVETQTSNQTDNDGRIYDEKNFITADLNITTKVYQDGGARHEIKDKAVAISKLPDSKIKIDSNGDLNTTATTINDDGDEVSIEVLGKTTGTTVAIHKLLVNGVETKATSKVPDTTTTVRADRVVETNATVGTTAISVLAQPDGKSQHTVTVGLESSIATVSIAGGQTSIDTTGTVTTSVDTNITAPVGRRFEAIAITDANGATVTKFRELDTGDGTTEYNPAPTLGNGESFPQGSDVNITKDSSDVIHIQTTLPALTSETKFNIE